MNPQQREQTPFFEPSDESAAVQGPASEQPPNALAGETAGNRAVEQGISTHAPMSPPQQSVAASPVTTPASLAVSPLSASAQVGAMPQIADDTDLIEKEWVEKAKQIVEQTAHDPHAQIQAINRVKVDYLKKRYNKDVKLIDD